MAEPKGTDLAQLAARVAPFVTVDDHGDGWCNIHVNLLRRDYGPASDHTPESLFVEADHPLAHLMRHICATYRQEPGHG